jgi:ribonuclease R
VTAEVPTGQDNQTLGSNGAILTTPERGVLPDSKYIHFTLTELREADALFVTPELLKDRPVVSGFAVDPPGALDKDDAFDVKRDGSGYLVHVSIADPSALILPGTVLDGTVRGKSFTRYFSDGKDPMLPEVLSDDRLSLHPHTPKPAITLTIPFGNRFQIGEPTLRRTTLIGRDALTYQEADEMMRSALFPEFEVLDMAFRIASFLASTRGTQYDFSSFTEITEEGRVVPIKWGEANLSMITVRELMILTNRLVAGYAKREEVPIPFRSHDGLESRAYYSATFNGHAGLGFGPDIPYSHFTSPLRRGADLRTQEQVIAVAEGRGPTYSYDEIDLYAREINAASDNYRDGNGRSEYAKKLVDARVRQALMEGDSSALDHLPTRRVIKVAAREGHVESLGSWLFKRLSTGRNGIVGAHLAPLIFNGEPDSATEAIVGQLASEYPGIIRESLEHISREGRFPIKYNGGKEYSRVLVQIGGDQYSSAPVRDPHRGIARDRAATQLVLNLRRRGVFKGVIS